MYGACGAQWYPADSIRGALDMRNPVRTHVCDFHRLRADFSPGRLFRSPHITTSSAGRNACRWLRRKPASSTDNAVVGSADGRRCWALPRRTAKSIAPSFRILQKRSTKDIIWPLPHRIWMFVRPRIASSIVQARTFQSHTRRIDSESLVFQCTE